MEVRSRRRISPRVSSLVAVFALFVIAFSAADVWAARPQTPEPPMSAAATDKAYCGSAGGSIAYEYISDVTHTIRENTISFVVEIYITNPSGCVAGQPCPSYDDSPEYVNGWIDWNGDEVWQPGERVMDLALTGYLNINYSGIMTAYAQATIPSEHAGQTKLRVNLGWGSDPNDPCTPSWTWGDVRDFDVNLGGYSVNRVTVLNGMAVCEVPDGVVWLRHYDDECRIADDRTAFADWPIATSTKRALKLSVDIESCDPNAAAPEIKARARFNGSGVASAWSSDGWHGELIVSTPDAVGVHTLLMEFSITDPVTGQEFEQEIARKVFVTLHETTFGLCDTGSGNRSCILDVICQYGSGARDSENLISRLRQGIYSSNRWIYHGRSPNWYRCNIVEMFDWLCGTGGCNYTTCGSYANLLVYMCAMHGVSSIALDTYLAIDDGFKGFITNSRASLDPSFLGSARHRDATGHEYRYRFGDHVTVRSSSSDRYHDPTFGSEYSGATDYIWRHYGGCGGLTTCYPYMCATPEDNCVKNTSESDYGGWPSVRYWERSLAQLASVGDVDAPQSLRPATGGIDFTGDFSFAPIDDDTDGTADALGVDIGLQVDVQSDYIVTGELYAGTEFVTAQLRYMGAPNTQFSYAGVPGSVVAHLEFSGEYIYRHGSDGPYQILVRVVNDTEGALEREMFIESPAYSRAQFGELEASISGVSDTGIDVDGDGRFDVLRVTVSVAAREAGDYRLLCALGKDHREIAAQTISGALSVGVQELQIDLDGRDIRSSGQDGPYELDINVTTPNGDVASQSADTQPYLATAFDLAAIGLDGVVDDMGVDIDSNGIFDFLRLGLRVSVEQPGGYLIHGWLSEPGPTPGVNGALVAFASRRVDLLAGAQTIALDFPSDAIYDHQVDGPYVLTIVQTEEAAGGHVQNWHPAYSTQAYSFQDFGEAAVHVLYSGYQGDHTLDTNANGRAEHMVVECGVTCNVDAVLLGFAELRDDFGRTVAQGQGYVAVTGGVPANLAIVFDGRYVYGTLHDDELHVVNGFIYPSGDIARGIDVPDVGTTQLYSWQEFEPAAVITGHAVLPNGSGPAAGGQVTADEAFDGVDASGRYRLVFMTGGSKRIQLAVPGYSDAAWEVYHNRSYQGHQDYAEVVTAVARVDTVDFLVGLAPTAAFLADPLSGFAPLTVTFTDQSLGLIDDWAWSFGDGTTSSLQNPQHIFVAPGAYSVMLTVAGPAGVSSATTEIQVNGAGCLWNDATSPPLDNSQLDGHGVAWGDFDGDGDDDLYLANNGPNKLLRNESGGVFTSMAHGAGELVYDSRGAAWADFDNDGDLDLYVVNWNGPNVLYRNDGGALVNATSGDLACPLQGNNAAWADVDRDGDLDLFVTNFDGPNKLLRNDGGGVFTSIASAACFTDKSRGCAWGDYDSDLDQDLYVSVEDGPNHLFRNDGGMLVDVTVSPLDDMGKGKGVDWGDFDNDGDLDLYLVNRLTENRLFVNDGGVFAISGDPVVADTGDGRSCGWGDYNNDGWLDLFVTNYSGDNKLFHNLHGTFADSTCGDLRMPITAWGMGWNDHDRDGDLDLYVSNHNWQGLASHMFRNDLITSKSWLSVRLNGTLSNRDGVGARIVATDPATGLTQMREITAGSSYMSQRAAVAQFGMGDANRVNLSIHWPSGIVQVLEYQPVNVAVEITEVAGASDAPLSVKPFQYAVSNHPNPFNPQTRIEFALPIAGGVTLTVYDVDGRLVKTLIDDVPYGEGEFSVVWNGTDSFGRKVASGVYFYRFASGTFNRSGRMVMLK